MRSVWHPKALCNVEMISYIWHRKEGHFCTDVLNYPDGAYVIHLFENIDPDVQTIYVIVGSKEDTVYRKRANSNSLNDRWDTFNLKSTL